jgi:RNA polymerase-binding transcription factor DksA
MAAAKKTAAKKSPTPKKSAATAPATKKAAATTSSAPARKAAAKTAPTRSASTKPPAAKASSTKPADTKSSSTNTGSTKTASTKASPTKVTARTAANKASAPAPTTNSTHRHPEVPEPRGVTKDGIAYTKDFDVKFLKVQRDALISEKARLLGQATRLEDEAHALIEEAEMGDVQFDDEGGEGDTMVVERERDLALSAQARQTIVDIDEALARIEAGTYGYSEASGRPIPRERLEAIPWAAVLVEEKVGGIGRR